MTTFTFTDRASYLAWRKQWKDDYARISQAIREIKLWRYWSARLTTLNFPHRYEAWKKLDDILPENVKERVLATVKRHSAGDYGYAEGSLQNARFNATQMLEDLKLAKIEAQKQYLEGKALVKK